ncbi:MAG TPA: isoaspartyl peptidase/L-asparaginase [Burkholderiaceae bacterium]
MTNNTNPAVVVHGGAGGSRQDIDGCEAAASIGLHRLRSGGSALDAAVDAVVRLEDDGRFNAGSGSVLCLDGTTVEMDAAIMDSQGALGAIACVQRVKNPVLLAREVARTPHWLLAGEGAERFARSFGVAEFYTVSEKAKRRHAELIAQLATEKEASYGHDNRAFERYWNYHQPHPANASMACDTVGAVTRDAGGHFAVAGSTGGSAPSLLGRVGDTPIIGSGFYAGAHGAVAVTGIGEHIVRHLLAHTIYRWIEEGQPLASALQRGVDLFPQEVDIGIIAVSRTEQGSRSNRDMPQAVAQ